MMWIIVVAMPFLRIFRSPAASVSHHSSLFVINIPFCSVACCLVFVENCRYIASRKMHDEFEILAIIRSSVVLIKSTIFLNSSFLKSEKFISVEGSF